MQKGIYKQINLEVKDFKVILKALKVLKCDELNKVTASDDAAVLKKYKIKEVNDKYDPLIERIKEKTL